MCLHYHTCTYFDTRLYHTDHTLFLIYLYCLTLFQDMFESQKCFYFITLNCFVNLTSPYLALYITLPRHTSTRLNSLYLIASLLTLFHLTSHYLLTNLLLCFNCLGMYLDLIKFFVLYYFGNQPSHYVASPYTTLHRLTSTHLNSHYSIAAILSLLHLTSTYLLTNLLFLPYISCLNKSLNLR